MGIVSYLSDTIETLFRIITFDVTNSFRTIKMPVSGCSITCFATGDHTCVWDNWFTSNCSNRTSVRFYTFAVQLYALGIASKDVKVLIRTQYDAVVNCALSLNTIAGVHRSGECDTPVKHRLLHIRGLSQKFVDNMDNFVQTRGKSILTLPLFCPSY